MSSEARQTVSYLSRRLSEVGLRPVNRFGQNFLIDLNLMDLLVRAADVQPHDVVLEIGTGLGGLTSRLAERAAAVVTVEVDRNLQQLAREELERHDNIRFVCADALANKNRLNPAVLEAVATELSADSKRQFKLAANLPYNIATPIVSNLLVAPAVPTSMTVTIQKEVAERLAARPSTKDYSALSVWVQSLCEVELIRILPPSVFWPRPRVESAIVQIRPQPALRARVADVEYFHAFIRALFLHRRKFLRGVLIAVTQDRLGKAAVDRILESFGFPSDRRAEQLAVDELLALTEAVRSTEASRSI